MAEVAQARVQQAVNVFVDDLDRSNLRKLQSDMHRCAASCCDRNELTLEQVHRCIEDCSTHVSAAQKLIQSELNNFQERLQRCVMQCQDKVRDQILPNTTETQVKAFRGDYESCVVQCADTHVDLISGIMKRIKQALSSQVK